MLCNKKSQRRDPDGPNLYKTKKNQQFNGEFSLKIAIFYLLANKEKFCIATLSGLLYMCYMYTYVYIF